MLKKIKLMDLIHAPELQVREINPIVVSTYSESVKAGTQFPAIMVDERNRIICGYHRYSAYKKNYAPDTLIECDVIKNKSDVELIMIAAGDNSRNGWPLTTFEKKTVSLRLIKEHKVNPTEVSKILGVRVNRIEEWGGMTVTIVGTNGMTKEEPLKRGFEPMAGKTVREGDYIQHKVHDYGVRIGRLCNQIISIVKRDSVWVTDEPALRELYSELKIYFNKQGEQS